MGYLIPMVTAGGWTQESLLVLGILSLILHHSTNQALVEASKAILLNDSLVSMINNVIHTSCSKGPALVEDDEETRNGETLTFVLLLHFFSCRRSVLHICHGFSSDTITELLVIIRANTFCLP